MLKTLSQFSACDLCINVLQLDSHFRIYITNQLVGQKEYRVDNGLVVICTCRDLLKTAKYTKIDNLCSFTVECPVQIYLDDYRKPWVLSIDISLVHLSTT